MANSSSEYQKNYRIKNREKILDYHKQYREKNKAILSEKQGKKYLCECGIELRIDHKARHERSIKHLDYLKSLSENI